MHKLSASLFLLALLPALPLGAAPLHYQIDLVADSTLPPHPLDGANLRLDVIWDASTLISRSIPAETFWPVDNTKAWLTVTGSSESNGVYTASLLSRKFWTIADITYQQKPYDKIVFPGFYFDIRGIPVHSSLLTGTFAEDFFQSVLPFSYPIAPLHPKPFESSDVSWDPLELHSSRDSEVSATVVAASAKAIPEPTALTSCVLALLHLAALRRRQ